MWLAGRVFETTDVGWQNQQTQLFINVWVDQDGEFSNYYGLVRKWRYVIMDMFTFILNVTL